MPKVPSLLQHGGHYQSSLPLHRVENALAEAYRAIDELLESEKTLVVHPRDCPHNYADKYTLVDSAVNTTCVLLRMLLDELSDDGFSTEKLKELCESTKGKTVKLEFCVDSTSKHIKTETKEHKSDTKVETRRTSTSNFFGNSTTTSQVVTTVDHHTWQLKRTFVLRAYVINSQSGSKEYVHTFFEATNEMPFETKGKFEGKPVLSSSMFNEALLPTPLTVNLTWLLRSLDPEGTKDNFCIDRSHADCYTPCQNKDVRQLMESFVNPFQSFLIKVGEVFKDAHFEMLNIHPESSEKQRCIMDILQDGSTDGTPFIGLFSMKIQESQVMHDQLIVTDSEENAMEGKGSAEVSGSSASTPATSTSEGVLLSSDEISRVLSRNKARIGEMKAKVVKLVNEIQDEKSFQGSLLGTQQYQQLLVTGRMVLCVVELRSVFTSMEALFKEQFVSAIGKHISPKDFEDYMDFHYQNLFQDQYRPEAFAYDVRHGNRNPEGFVSIETGNALAGNQKTELIRTCTMQASADNVHEMFFKLSASTSVPFSGERYLHTGIAHQWGSADSKALYLRARARQFSSFIVMVGTIGSAREFIPKAATIVQNRDDFVLKLMAETIPTPKEFRDAIESLSPEQQAFCKAYRSMQLASTLFAVLTIEIKPQLEKVLKLPAGSLTKEITLTQDLMTLFTEYQISSDLLCYDGQDDKSNHEKLTEVKNHVAVVNKIIDGERQKEIEDAKQKAQKALLNRLEDSDGEDGEEFGISSANEELLRSANTFGAPPPRGSFKMMSRSKGLGAPRQRAMLKMKTPSMSFSAAPKCAPPVVKEQVGGGMSVKPGGTSKAMTPNTDNSSGGSGNVDSGNVSLFMTDYTKLPNALNKNYDEYDDDNCLRPTKLTLADSSWTLSSQDGLLSKPKTTNPNKSDQDKRKNAAFDLLDALTKSGVLSITEASLHVIVMATHCFADSIMDTVLKRNVNPIEKVERSQLIMCSTVQQKPIAELINERDYLRISGGKPKILELLCDNKEKTK